MAPLGYETKDRRIVVVEEEAERVRTIFRSYLTLGSLNLVMADLRHRGIVTKLRTLKNRPQCWRNPLCPWPARLSSTQQVVGDLEATEQRALEMVRNHVSELEELRRAGETPRRRPLMRPRPQSTPGTRTSPRQSKPLSRCVSEAPSA